MATVTTPSIATEIPLHPIVGDRVIHGTGTSVVTWQNWQPLFDLPTLNIADNFPTSKRVCLFAPHPDDEILGGGGLLQCLAENGNEIVLVSVTNGTQSHPNSAQYSADSLHQIRPQETKNALIALGIAQKVKHVLLDLPDGAVFAHKAVFFEKLKTLIQPDDSLVTVFDKDGHPDHEATGQVVSDFATQHGLPCYQMLIWAWHWASPNDPRIDWQRLQRLPLTDSQTAKKRQALSCFTSQILPDPTTGNEAVLPNYAIERILAIGEIFLKNS